MKKSKFKLLLCLTLMGAVLFTGCGAAENLKQSENIGAQALGQMIDANDPELQAAKVGTVIDIKTDLPAECKLSKDKMKEAITEFITETNADLEGKDAAITVVFQVPPKENGKVHWAREEMVIITITGTSANTFNNGPEAGEQSAIELRFDTIKECFGWLYNRNQITLLGERTPFAEGK